MQTYTIVAHILKYRRTIGIFVTDNSNFYLEPCYTITIIIPKTSPIFFVNWHRIISWVYNLVIKVS